MPCKQILGCLLLLEVILGAVSPPNPVYEAATFSKRVAQVQSGVKYHVEAPNRTSLDVIHLFGSPYERGKAHGELLAPKEVMVLR